MAECRFYGGFRSVSGMSSRLMVLENDSADRNRPFREWHALGVGLRALHCYSSRREGIRIRSYLLVGDLHK